MQKYIFTIIILIFIGCGYKPTINYAQNSFKGSIYTILHVDINNGKNSVFLKDYTNRLLLTKFNTHLAKDKKNANMIIDLELLNISETAIQTDSDGYVKIYKVTVTAKIKYWNNIPNAKIKQFTLSNYDTYTVYSDSALTSQSKDRAIQNAISKLLDTLVSTVAINNV